MVLYGIWFGGMHPVLLFTHDVYVDRILSFTALNVTMVLYGIWFGGMHRAG